MADWIYVDNSNVFIEGKRVSAVRSGMVPTIWDAFDYGVLDHGYRLSFGKLYQFVAGNNEADTARAMLFGSRPPQNDAIGRLPSKRASRSSSMIATWRTKRRRSTRGSSLP